MEYRVFIDLILYGAGVDKFTPNWFFYKVIKNYLKDMKNLFSYAVLKILDTFDVLMKNSYRCALFCTKTNYETPESIEFLGVTILSGKDYLVSNRQV